MEQGYTLPNMHDVADPYNRPALVEQERQHLSIFKAQSDACKYSMDVNDLRFMGTATVARDVDFMAKVLDGDDGKMCAASISFAALEC
jgi:hypothetical protein